MATAREALAIGRARRKKIDVSMALLLGARGLTYREVGVLLAREDNRPVCYRPDSVQYAIYKCLRDA